jgi:porin
MKNHFFFAEIAMVSLVAGMPTFADEAGRPPETAAQGEPTVWVGDFPEDDRHQPHSVRPDVPSAQHPALSTDENSDTGKPVDEWQHLTDDWLGARPRLDDHGITFESSATIDWSANMHGGANTEGSAFRHLFNLDLTLDTERLVGWKGGTFFLNFLNQHGEDGSVDVGDAQAYSNIDADGRTELGEVWYEQVCSDDRLRIKIGKVDTNSEFAYTDHGGEFINSSMGVSPTIFVLPTYPDPATSVNLFFKPVERWVLGLGVYDGAGQEGITTGTRGPKTFFGHPSDLFVVGEVGLSWDMRENLPGRLAVGVWGHTGTFATFDGGTDSGTTGFYCLVDQRLWQEDPCDEEGEQGFGMFFQYGYANPDASAIEHHVGGGVAWTGLVPSRDYDVAGLGMTAVFFTDEPGAGFTDDHELTIELFYRVRWFEWLSIKPDLQHISNPGGVGLGDALAGTLRVDIDF